MRQPRFERGTFGSGGGDGQRPLTLAAVVSGTYVGRASASASQRRPRCYHRCYRGHFFVELRGCGRRGCCNFWQHPFPSSVAPYDIRTVQELLGHRDLRPTMILHACIESGRSRGPQPCRQYLTRRIRALRPGGLARFHAERACREGALSAATAGCCLPLLKRPAEYYATCTRGNCMLDWSV